MTSKILVVEDNPTNRAMLKDVLNYYGYEVIEAKDGAEGVQLAREYMPQLILMDIQMPVMDGFAATKMLKSDPQTKNIKIVSLSAYSSNEAENDFLKAGFDDAISKPIDIRQLPDLVKKHMG